MILPSGGIPVCILFWEIFTRHAKQCLLRINDAADLQSGLQDKSVNGSQRICPCRSPARLPMGACYRGLRLLQYLQYRSYSELPWHYQDCCSQNCLNLARMHIYRLNKTPDTLFRKG